MILRLSPFCHIPASLTDRLSIFVINQNAEDQLGIYWSCKIFLLQPFLRVIILCDSVHPLAASKSSLSLILLVLALYAYANPAEHICQ